MFTAIQKQWVVGLILIGFAVGTLSFFAQAQEREPQPGDYFWLEAVSGSVGALAGGFAIAYAGVIVISYLYPCKSQTAIWSCVLGTVWTAGIGFLIGAPVGAATVVVMTGSSKHVRGNILLTLTGAIAGEAVGLFVFPSLFSGSPLLVVSSLVLSTALGATLGYNINATIEPVVLSPVNQGLILVGLRTNW